VDLCSSSRSTKLLCSLWFLLELQRLSLVSTTWFKDPYNNIPQVQPYTFANMSAETPSRATSMLDDDDDSVLDLSEQTQRPRDVALNQQRINAWHPILDPVWVIVALFMLGVILVPVGVS